MNPTAPRRVPGWAVLLVAFAIVGAATWLILQGPRR